MGRKHTTRHRARRKLESADTACDTINAHLAEIAGWYEKDMPQVHDALLQIGQIIEAARKLIAELRVSI